MSNSSSCARKKILGLNVTATGELIIIHAAGETGNRNGRVTQQLFNGRTLMALALLSILPLVSNFPMVQIAPRCRLVET